MQMRAVHKHTHKQCFDWSYTCYRCCCCCRHMYTYQFAGVQACHNDARILAATYDERLVYRKCHAQNGRRVLSVCWNEMRNSVLNDEHNLEGCTLRSLKLNLFSVLHEQMLCVCVCKRESKVSTCTSDVHTN